MASSTPQTRVWASSRSWWWTGNPGVLQSMGLQRVGHDWATELNWCWPSGDRETLLGCVTICWMVLWLLALEAYPLLLYFCVVSSTGDNAQRTFLIIHLPQLEGPQEMVLEMWNVRLRDSEQLPEGQTLSVTGRGPGFTAPPPFRRTHPSPAWASNIIHPSNQCQAGVSQHSPQGARGGCSHSSTIFFSFVATSCGMWDLTSPARNRTCVLCIGRAESYPLGRPSSIIFHVCLHTSWSRCIHVSGCFQQRRTGHLWGKADTSLGFPESP